MSKAIVLITSYPGKDREVANNLKNVEGVGDVYLAAGRYDVVAEIQAPDDASMLSLIYDKIRKIDNIKKTHTMFCLKI
jgi:DNA-binding Lrp family transcriptional regulator